MSIMERGSERALGREPSDTAKSSGQVDNVHLAALTDNCKLLRLINSVGGYSVERLCTGQPVMSPVVASSPNRHWHYRHGKAASKASVTSSVAPFARFSECAAM